MDSRQDAELIVLAASLIACIRLKGQEVKPSPKLSYTIFESVEMAKQIVAAVRQRGV